MRISKSCRSKKAPVCSKSIRSCWPGTGSISSRILTWKKWPEIRSGKAFLGSGHRALRAACSRSLIQSRSINLRNANMTVFSDRALSQKLERTEARANAGFVESRARLYPESGAQWIEVAGAYAMFDGVDSPCTQTFGLGMFDEASDGEMERIEAFFASHDAPVFHEVSPLADPSLIALLNKRDYEPLEYSTVLYQRLDGNLPDMPRRISTRLVADDEIEVWAKTAAAGWASEAEGLAEFMLNFGRISANASGASPFLAELDGKPVASGMI